MIRKLPIIIRTSILLITLYTIVLKSEAQVFPVQVNIQLTPPFSPYLSDYTASGQQKLMVQLRSNDAGLSDYNVKLRITIEGLGITIRTKQNFIPQPITIQGGGIPLIVYGEDLHEYFNSNNLDFLGLSRREFDKTGKLPEGVYRFSVEVLDYNRGTVVSNKGTTIAWIILNDPPLLNLPRKDTKITILDPTNIPFTWTPRHTGSPNSAFSTEYIFRLVEIWPANRNPYDAFLSQPVLYEAITSQSQIIYGMAEPALIPGRKYAWQVQARDVDAKDLFKNQGKSEVYVFQYGDAIGLPENLRKEGGSDVTISLRWEPSVNGEMPDQYRVRYTPKFNDNWYESITQNRWITLSELQPNTDYQIQVRAEKAKQFSEYTTVQRVSTNDKTTSTYNCGQPPNIPLPSGSNSLFVLTPGDIFSSADFKVVVTEVTSGENGMFTGKGMMSVNLMNGASVEVTFSGNINNKYELTTGSVVSTYERGSEMAQVVDQMHKIGEKKQVDQNTQNNNTIVKPDITVTGTIDSIYVNSEGKIVVIDDGGNTSTYDQKKDEQTGKAKETVIVDAAGNTYIVGADGKVTKGSGTSPLASAGNIKNYPVLFKPATDQQYGFDKLTYDAHINNYQRENINGGEALVVWKSVASGRTDKVIAWTDKMTNLFDAVAYESAAGDLSKTKKDDGVEITLVGGNEDVSEVIAYQPDPAKQSEKTIVGRINVISYDPIVRNLVLVSVNGATVPPAASLTTELNKIFGPSIVSWNVNPVKTLKADLGSDGKLDDGSSGLLSNYTQEMRDVIREFKAGNDIVDETYYLFFVGEGETQPRKDGYMPRKKQCGFIFTNSLRQEILAKTIAHELAHGAFRLEHTFETYPSLTKGTTDNLMDYNTGTRLHKYQWDLVHDPVAVWGLFEGDEEGAFSLPCLGVFDECDDVLKTLQNLREAVLNNEEIIAKYPNDGKVRREALKVEINGVEYNNITIIYGGEPNTKYYVEPQNYEDFRGEFFTAEGRIETQEGFVIKFGTKPVVKILLFVDEDKFKTNKEALRKYLFGPEGDAGKIETFLSKNDVLSPVDIKDIREKIGSLKDEEMKKKFYRDLQDKVPYHNQRDNVSIATDEDVDNNSDWLNEGGSIGDIMCNLTCLAACIEYLGKQKPCSSCPSDCSDKELFPDYLECVHRSEIRPLGNDDYHRSTVLSRKLLSEYFDISQETKEQINTVEDVKKYLGEKLGAGYGVMASISGHLVRIQNFDDEHMIIDDPYGHLDMERKLDGSNAYRCKSCSPQIDNRNKDGNNIGNNSKWKLEDAIKIIVRYECYYNN